MSDAAALMRLLAAVRTSEPRDDEDLAKKVISFASRRWLGYNPATHGSLDRHITDYARAVLAATKYDFAATIAEAISSHAAAALTTPKGASLKRYARDQLEALVWTLHRHVELDPIGSGLAAKALKGQPAVLKALVDAIVEGRVTGDNIVDAIATIGLKVPALGERRRNLLGYGGG